MMPPERGDSCRSEHLEKESCAPVYNREDLALDKPQSVHGPGREGREHECRCSQILGFHGWRTR